jgi:outer membrane protein OmpA-like peptidoglycan-associated protein
MGGSDLYMSRRLTDSTWSEPQHLAFPLNDHLDNFGLVVRPDGTEAFLARGGLAHRDVDRVDLYRLSLPKVYRPTPILWWTVWVADQSTRQPVSNAAWTISSPEGSAQVSHQGASYQVALPEGSPLGFQIQAAGYQLLSERKVLDVRKADARVDTLWLQPIRAGQRTRLENLYFATDSDVLLPASQPELVSLAAWLTANPTVRVRIEGHTDNQGSAAYNLDLSTRRARGVYLELINKGIDSNRLEFNGFGLSKPIESNETERGRARNRRTEILIL